MIYRHDDSIDEKGKFCWYYEQAIFVLQETGIWAPSIGKRRDDGNDDTILREAR